MALAPGRILTQGLGSFGSASHLLTLGFGFGTTNDYTTTRFSLIGTSQQRQNLIGTSQQRQTLVGSNG